MMWESEEMSGKSQPTFSTLRDATSAGFGEHQGTQTGYCWRGHTCATHQTAARLGARWGCSHTMAGRRQFGFLPVVTRWSSTGEV